MNEIHQANSLRARLAVSSTLNLLGVQPEGRKIRPSRYGRLHGQHPVVKGGARQGSCRPGHAAEGLFSVPGQDAALTMTSRSGFKATASIGSQLRVWRDQRPGLRSRAWR